MIKNAREFKEYFFSRLVASLGFLCGTPGARVLQRATSKANAKAKLKSAAVQKMRYGEPRFVGQLFMDTIQGRACIPTKRAPWQHSDFGTT